MSKKFCNFRVKYQGSSIGFEHLAYPQSIENKCKGLTEVVQEQNQAIKKTSDQIIQLATTVENLTNVQPQPLPQSQPQPQSMRLRLPKLVLPEFTGKEPLDPFLKRIQNLLVTSYRSRTILVDFCYTAMPERLTYV